MENNEQLTAQEVIEELIDNGIFSALVGAKIEAVDMGKAFSDLVTAEARKYRISASVLKKAVSAAAGMKVRELAAETAMLADALAIYERKKLGSN